MKIISFSKPKMVLKQLRKPDRKGSLSSCLI